MTLPDDILQTIIIPALIRIGGAIIILIISRLLAGMARKAVVRVMVKTDLTDSFITLFKVLTYYSVFILGIIVALAVLGVPVTSLVAGVGLILVVLGIAMQQSLGNFAATIIFLLFKPFEVGNVIETSGFIGVVKEIELFNTVILTADQKVVTLPNSKIQGAGITNYSKMGILRSDLVFGIGYEDDIAKAKKILKELVSADDRILAEPETQIAVVELGDSSVNIAVRPFVKLADYWAVPTDLTERVKLRFEEAGISIPYPQRDVHLFQANGQEAVS